MRIHIATDHAGLEFSTDLQHHLAERGYEVVDHGPADYDPLDDYPSFCINAARAVVRDQEAGVDALGIVRLRHDIERGARPANEGALRWWCVPRRRRTRAAGGDD